MDDVDIDAKELAQILSLGRIVLGAAAVIAPNRFGRAMTGEQHRGRHLHVRDPRARGARRRARASGRFAPSMVKAR